MSKKNSKKDKKLVSIERDINEESTASKYISFNYQYYTYEGSAGQSFENWECNQFLSDLSNKLVCFSKKTKMELIRDKTMELYNAFPPDSGFTVPKCLTGKKVHWARLRLTGTRRLIGVFSDTASLFSDRDVFYIVFLDSNHEFAPYHKK